MIAVLPYILGFHPSQSIVVLCLHESHLGLIQRLDLPTNDAVGQAIDGLLPSLVREHPDAVLLVGYEATTDQSSPALNALSRALRSVHVMVTDRLVVYDGRWRSLDCDNPDCCPHEGTAVPEPADLAAIAAEYVGQEVVPLPDRQALARQLEPDAPVSARVGRLLAHHPKRQVDEPGEWVHPWPAVLDASDDPQPLTAGDAAGAARSLWDVGLRDGLVAWLTPGTLDPTLISAEVRDRLSQLNRCWDEHDSEPMAVVAQNRIQARLVRLCAMLPDRHAAPALTVLASFTWWRGDGALTRVALDRALRCDPDYRLALLLQHMVDLAIRSRPNR
nr:DUF4192 domain-containing protein [Pedococcus badiiscoriae]